MRIQNEVEGSPNAGSKNRDVYFIAGMAALVAALIAIIEVVIEAGASSLTSSPSTVTDWFTLLQTHQLLGLALLGIFETAFFPILVITFIGMYFALKGKNALLMAVALALDAMATTLYLGSNNALSMLFLSNQYVAATTDVQRTSLLAAGQAVISAGQGTGVAMAFFFGSLAPIIVSVVMLRSKIFGKPIAIIGIVGNVLGLPGPALGPVLWAINGLLVLFWTILVGIRLIQLARSPAKMEMTAD